MNHYYYYYFVILLGDGGDRCSSNVKIERRWRTRRKKKKEEDEWTNIPKNPPSPLSPTSAAFPIQVRIPQYPIRPTFDDASHDRMLR